MAKRVFILSERFGTGADQLGALLMRNFLYSLAREESAPASIAFANSAVRLACEGSESLEDLRLLAEKGVALKACGTCLDYYGISDRLAVGEVGTMPGTVEAMMSDGETVILG